MYPGKHPNGGSPDATEQMRREMETLDLKQYASGYTGLMRINRLLYLAEHCSVHRVKALEMALVYAKETLNVAVYEDIHCRLVKAIRELLPDTASTPPLDTAWMENARKAATAKMEKLRKPNSEKLRKPHSELNNGNQADTMESMGVIYDERVEHFINCGDLGQALQAYPRAKDYRTSNKHMTNMYLNLIRISIYMNSWEQVHSFIDKAKAFLQIADPKGEQQAVHTKLRCASGLFALYSREYKQAAKHFLQVSFHHCDYAEVLSANNVAVYGGLCALATFSYKELKQNIIGRGCTFKEFLLEEPQLLNVIVQFCEPNYSICLKLLDQMRDNLLLDMYLAPHVHALYAQIRSRALVQYFVPYATVDMTKMAAAFNTTVPSLEDELTQLILDGLINARIDHNKTLHRHDVDQRSTTFESALQMGKEFQRRTKALILRSAVLRNRLQIHDIEGGDRGGDHHNGVYTAHYYQENSPDPFGSPDDETADAAKQALILRSAVLRNQPRIQGARDGDRGGDQRARDGDRRRPYFGLTMYPGKHPNGGSPDATEQMWREMATLHLQENDANYVVENPTLDLKQYPSGYTGLMRINRLLYLAEHCSVHRVKALEMALVYAKETLNVAVYEDIHCRLVKAIRELLPDTASTPPLDTAWMENAGKAATDKMEMLGKPNSEKLRKPHSELNNGNQADTMESMGVIYDERVEHFINCGDLGQALQAYPKDYHTSNKHMTNMYLNLIRISIYMNSWEQVHSFIEKAKAFLQIADPTGEQKAVHTKLTCASGLFALYSREYKQAAEHFLQASFDHCDYAEVLSANNVAVYGGLCALATFGYKDLQRDVIGSAFKKFLLEEPQLLKVIVQFCKSKYSICFKLLDQMRDNLLLDMYLAPHVHALYAKIRSSAVLRNQLRIQGARDGDRGGDHHNGVYEANYHQGRNLPEPTHSNTTIAGLRHDGKIWLAADSKVSFTLFKKDVPEHLLDNSEVAKLHWVVAFMCPQVQINFVIAGDLGMGDDDLGRELRIALEGKFCSIEKFIPLEVAEDVRSTLSSIRNGRSAVILLAVVTPKESELYLIEEDVIPVGDVQPWFTEGSGGQHADAVLKMHVENGQPKLDPIELMQESIQSGADADQHSGGPITVTELIRGETVPRVTEMIRGDTKPTYYPDLPVQSITWNPERNVSILNESKDRDVLSALELALKNQLQCEGKTTPDVELTNGHLKVSKTYGDFSKERVLQKVSEFVKHYPDLTLKQVYRDGDTIHLSLKDAPQDAPP